MSPVSELLKRIEENSSNAAIVYEDDTYLYADLLALKKTVDLSLIENGVHPGDVVALLGDYSPLSMAILLSLLENRNIVVPISIGMDTGGEQYLSISDPDFLIETDYPDFSITSRQRESQKNDLLSQMASDNLPGLILFTSGTTGTPKAVLHDMQKLMSKFLEADKRYTTLCFLMFDHIGGVDTYFYSLFSGGLAVFPNSRDPAYICQLVERHEIEVLPVSPTFLNLVLLSGAHKQSDMSSLKIITFGSEKISDHLLQRVGSEFDSVRLLQKYGITELGSPSSKTHADNPSLIKMHGEQIEARVVDGILQLRTPSAMVGYLNADSPFTADGWFVTGDAAEVHGGYIKILGRKSDLMNVGGEKVYPAEVESVILEMDSVAEVTVFGEANPILGEMVCAKVRPVEEVDETEEEQFTITLKDYCAGKMEKHKVPVKLYITNEKLHSDRFKKVTGSGNAG